MTRWEAFCLVFRSVVLQRPNGRHHPARTAPADSEATAEFPALTRNPYPQEPTA